MSPSTSLSLTLLIAGTLAACAPSAEDNAGRPIAAPLSSLSADDAYNPDAPDGNCQVVLRRVRPTFEIDQWGNPVCGRSICTLLVDIDVSTDLAAQAGFQGVELAASNFQGDWNAFQAYPSTDPSDAGFERYTAQVELANNMELIPFATTEFRGVTQRLWDHNAHQGNYHITPEDDFSIAYDSSVCGPEGTKITFSEDYQQSTDGELVAGGNVLVDYALSRLPNCRGKKYGYPAWGISAFARFDSSPEIFSQAVTGGGTPYNDNLPVLASFDIPENATHLEMWFHNSDYWGCSGWDSQYGNNYSFSIAPASL